MHVLNEEITGNQKLNDHQENIIWTKDETGPAKKAGFAISRM